MVSKVSFIKNVIVQLIVEVKYVVKELETCRFCKSFKHAKIKRGSSHGHVCLKEIYFPVSVFGYCELFEKDTFMDVLRDLI